MLDEKETLKISQKSMVKTLTNFLVIWFLVVLCFYVVASFSTFTFIFTTGGLNGFPAFSLIFVYWVEGVFIAFYILSSRHILKNYKNYNFTLELSFRWEWPKEEEMFILFTISGILGTLPFALGGLLMISAYISSSLSTYQSLPAADIALVGVADIFSNFMYFAALIAFMLGIIILIKNPVSTVARLFFASFLSIGMACLMYFLYDSTYPLIVYDWTIPKAFLVDNPLAIQLFFLFVLLTQLGFFLLIHAIRLITSSGRFWLPKKLYLVLFALIVFSTLLLFSGEIKHVWIEPSGLLMALRVREFSFGFSIIYLLIQVIPIVISLYYLFHLPPWITPERRAWLNRIKLGIITYSFFPICETIAGLRIPLTTGFVSAYNPLERYKLILAVAFLILFLSILLLFSGVPELDKWFFDEIKFRASPELRKFDPNVNLAAIWEQVDDWQKESNLTRKEMTNKKLEEYVQAAKNLILKEEGKPVTV